jgi:hypothetical protein
MDAEGSEVGQDEAGQNEAEEDEAEDVDGSTDDSQWVTISRSYGR